MQALNTAPNIDAAIIACKKLEEEFRCKYIANASARDRDSKYFYIGCDGWYESDEHLAVLAQCGFNSIDEYDTAFEKSPRVIAYNKFNDIFKLVKGDARKHLIADMSAAGLWNETTSYEMGFELYALAKKHAPKMA